MDLLISKTTIIIIIIIRRRRIMKLTITLHLRLAVPKGATPVHYTSTTDWQRAVRRDNVTSITLEF